MKHTSTPSMPLSQRNIIEYGKFLDKSSWTFFCTFSTHYPLSLKSSRSSIQRFHCFLKQNMNLENSIFWIAEPFESRYGYHIHALVKIFAPEPEIYKPKLIKAWQIVTNGAKNNSYNWTNISPYIPELGANFYLTKYIGRADIDYDLI
jgi:hypothetical protein